MKIDVIKEKLTNIIEGTELEIFSIQPKKEFGEHILEILLDGKNMTTLQLEAIHQKLYDALDDDDLEDYYFLELSSVGLERPIRSFDELKKHIDSYMYFESSAYKGNATLLQIEDDVCTFKINLKGRMTKIKIKYEELNKLRLAVKI